MQLLLGYIGLFNLVMLSPVLLTLVLWMWCCAVDSIDNVAQFLLGMANLSHLTGVIFGFIVLNGFCDNVVSDYLWARAVVLTSPTVATIGMSITIPLAMVSDSLLGKKTPTGLSVFGAFLVVIGFLLVNVTTDLQRDALRFVTERFSLSQIRTNLSAPGGEYAPVETK